MFEPLPDFSSTPNPQMTNYYKYLESKLHDYLYDIIEPLTHIYPTTEDFQDVFKRNMFVENNEAAFQHVTHYLCTILNPELTKEVFTWPVDDGDDENGEHESTFEYEVLAFIDVIRAEYEDAAIPNATPSDLMSSGGYNFMKFMLKITLLVVREHLKKYENVELSTNIVEISIEVLVGEVTTQKKTFVRNMTFEKPVEGAAEAELRTANKRLRELKREMNDFRALDLIMLCLDDFKVKNAVIEEMKQRSEKSDELVRNVSINKPNYDGLVVPESFTDVLQDDDGLSDQPLVNMFAQDDGADVPVAAEDQLDDVDKLNSFAQNDGANVLVAAKDQLDDIDMLSASFKEKHL